MCSYAKSCKNKKILFNNVLKPLELNNVNSSENIHNFKRIINNNSPRLSKKTYLYRLNKINVEKKIKKLNNSLYNFKFEPNLISFKYYNRYKNRNRNKNCNDINKYNNLSNLSNLNFNKKLKIYKQKKEYNLNKLRKEIKLRLGNFMPNNTYNNIKFSKKLNYNLSNEIHINNFKDSSIYTDNKKYSQFTIDNDTYKKKCIDSTVFDKNYLYAIKYNNNRNSQNDKNFKLIKDISNTTHLNSKSQILFTSVIEKLFLKIFNLLNLNKEDVITFKNFVIKHIPDNILIIISPIIKELYLDNRTLKKEEFITACKQIYNTLNYYQKRKIYIFGKNNCI